MRKMPSGYGMILQSVMKNPDISIEAKAIYSLLASYTGNKQYCFPSVQTICKDLAISENRFYKHMQQLIDAGLVVKSKLFNDIRNNNKYEIMYPEGDEPPQNDGFQPLQNEGVEDLQNGGFNNSNNITVTNNNTASKPKRLDSLTTDKLLEVLPDTTTELFSKFWTTYRKKEDKKKALILFSKLDSITQQKAVDKAITYTNNTKDNDIKFIKNPYYWLRDEKYNDDYGETEKTSIYKKLS